MDSSSSNSMSGAGGGAGASESAAATATASASKEESATGSSAASPATASKWVSDAPAGSSMSDAQQRAQRQLEARVGKHKFPSAATAAWADSGCCNRYLRARAWDVEKAVQALTATAQWRHDIKLDALMEDPSSIKEALAVGKMYISTARDRNGHPIVINRKAKQRPPESEFLLYQQFIGYALESAARAAEAVGQEKNYSRANSPPMHVSRGTLSIMQNHYPERLHHCFLVNAPWLFRAGWRVLSPFVDAVTKAKLEFVTRTDKAAFAKYIDDTNLEPTWGGTHAFKFDYKSYIERHKRRRSRQAAESSPLSSTQTPSGSSAKTSSNTP